MADSKSIEKQGKRVKELAKKIQEKDYSLQDLHEFTELLNSMNEKVAVLKYLTAKNDFLPTELKETKADIPNETKTQPVNVIVEKEEPEVEPEITEETPPAFSFNLFDAEPAKEEETAEPEPKEEVKEEPKAEEKKATPPSSSNLSAAIEERKASGSLNDNYFGQEDNSLANKLKNTPIQNLKSAIGINVKFAFINDLFSGNADDFNQSVEAIDLMNNADEARELLGELSGKNSWDLESETVSQFVEMVERRFM